MQSHFAFLTGDLIGSTDIGPEALERAVHVLRKTADEIAEWQGGRETRFTRFRGDGWQIMLATPWLALRASVVLMARLRAETDLPDTRISIGIGPIDSPGILDLSDARGAAPERSGRALDNMRHADRMAIAGVCPIRLHRAIIALIDERTTRWTPEQAEAAAHYLSFDEPTLAAIAQTLGISPQAVSYRLNGAGAGHLRNALREWESEVGMTEGAP